MERNTKEKVLMKEWVIYQRYNSTRPWTNQELEEYLVRCQYLLEVNPYEDNKKYFRRKIKEINWMLNKRAKAMR